MLVKGCAGENALQVKSTGSRPGTPSMLLYHEM